MSRDDLASVVEDSAASLARKVSRESIAVRLIAVSRDPTPQHRPRSVCDEASRDWTRPPGPCQADDGG